MANFEGHFVRDCGEHRTTGDRAWCFTCSEWCYPDPDLACLGCRSPILQARIDRLELREDFATQILQGLSDYLDEDNYDHPYRELIRNYLQDNQ